ncbi:hypothetical protein CHLRE_03g187600v5 [Chlamydomonas reinhardtii]|uniref:Uncharacterized protein n=1 Tax=Chlamydomonas reinhardtii TaxID=3055 RepID=A0A2K3DY53_CHLRE|nr:uncharacterized protein CHLRE_03g187600v5 [Chlamydomonas reinhardtii]PNW85463.1 hypothetical protein CHLRE_03g187600v5 [Chlamydomonas reinhardtii]
MQELKAWLQRQLGPPLFEKLSEGDIAALHLAGYDGELLGCASRESLLQLKLTLPVVDMLLAKCGARPRPLGRESTASDGGTDAAANAEPPPTFASMASYTSRFAAHIPTPSGKAAATVVGRRHLATYAHGAHSSWTLGQKMQVAVHSPYADRRQHVEAEVVYKSVRIDLVLLEVQQDLPCPELEAGTPAGDTFIIHGQLSPHPALRENYDNTCVCHGWVAATSPDNRSHIRGHSSSGGADSEGGGCFDVATGRLFAIAMAAISGSNAVTMLPVIVIVPILAGLRSAPEAS